jgi:hypothetical protein
MLHNKKAPSLTDSPNIDNPNIEFFCPVYRDFLLVDRLSKQVQALYPNHTFVVISDGLIPATAESDRLRTNLGSRNHTLIETSDRLKLIEFGGAWLERLYQIVLTQTTADGWFDWKGIPVCGGNSSNSPTRRSLAPSIRFLGTCRHSRVEAAFTLRGIVSAPFWTLVNCAI